MENINQKVSGAIKWSTVTEIIAKLITPLTTIILARLLTPEAFGVIATIVMIISFADMFSDAGFQKYIIQHDFKNKIQKYNTATVAFWTNLMISTLLWILISIFSEHISYLVGNPNLTNALIIGCISLPINAFSSIQIALLRRDLNYKALFMIRIVGIFIPFIVTIPLAFIFNSYWSLIVGVICGNLSNAIISFIESDWKPKFYYKIKLLKKMFSFSVWSLIESISIWLTLYAGIFIVGNTLNSYYLGIYQTSITTVNQLMTIVTSATTPILFATLSRLQNDDLEFNVTFLKFQRLVGLLILPMGVGIFIYSDLITTVLLGHKWMEAAGFIGIWGLIGGITIILGQYCSEVYRAKGRPKLSLWAQIMHLIFLIPTLIISSKFSFEILYYATSLIRLQGVFVHFLIMKHIVKFPVYRMLENIFIPFLCSILMGIFAFYIKSLNDNVVWSLITILISITLYISLILLFPSTRKDVYNLIKNKKMYKKAV